jgi:hypothetical protein
MDNPTHSAFASKHPECSRQIANLGRMEDAIASLCFPLFFEPVSVLDDFGPGASPKLLGPMAPALNAWTRHIAYGTIARIRSLTEPLNHNLLDGQLTIASILQRTILENAGRAAYAIERLRDCGRRGSWDDLRAIIPKTLFGTCMTSLEDSLFEDFSDLTAQRPTKVAQFLEALETLAGTENASGQSYFGGLYSLLCDLAHASQRANQGYCRILETTGEGWTIQYGWEEEVKREAIEGALKSTMRCIQGGYAASAMLLTWEFSETAGVLERHSLSETEADWIWRNLLDPGLVFG